jgi:V8-like Glu-specific endopeptidase
MIDPSIPCIHELSNGELVQHDVYEATRFPLFASDFPGFPVFSLGGTLFLVRYREKAFAVSARHILGTPMTDPSSLIIHERNRVPQGSKLDFVSAHSFEIPLSEMQSGPDDAFDLIVWEFQTGQHGGVQWYRWDPNTICECETGNRLSVVGYLFDKSNITNIDENTSRAIVQISKFGFRHVRKAGDDQASLKAIALFPLDFVSKVQNFNGLSGAPVFDDDQGKICGMVVRGGIDPKTGQAQLDFVRLSGQVQVQKRLLFAMCVSA